MKKNTPLHLRFSANPNVVDPIVAQLMTDQKRTRHVLAAALVASSSLVSTINATGGLVTQEGERDAPAADMDWIDLGEAAQFAAEVLRKAGITEKLRVVEEP